MTIEDFHLTEKYSDEYSIYCSNRVCGEECPVFVAHAENPKISCFMHFCHLRENGVITDITK